MTALQPGPSYRAGPINRARRTKAQIEQLDRQILDVLGEDHPQSVRHVLYRITDPRLLESIEKSDKAYRHVQNRIVKLRQARTLPYGWITDATLAVAKVAEESERQLLGGLAGMLEGLE